MSLRFAFNCDFALFFVPQFHAFQLPYEINLTIHFFYIVHQNLNNNKATPLGQKIFDKLLKACNEVSWNEQSILVLNHIRVDPPYAPENCILIDKSGGLDEHSLERVKKIVGVANGV